MSIRLVGTEPTFDFVCRAIENRTRGRYLRFGDGDFNLMQGQNDMLATANTDLQNGLIATVKGYRQGDMFSVNYHCKDLNSLEPGMRPGVHEVSQQVAYHSIGTLKKYVPDCDIIYSPIALHHTLSERPERFAHILNLIRKNANTILCHTETFEYSKLAEWFGPHESVKVPKRDSYSKKASTLQQLEEACKNVYGYVVVIVGMGCGGRAMIPEMEEILQKYTKEYFLLDIGSPIDILMGLNDTRAWIEMTRPNLEAVRKALQAL
jgi:hypothetical protein